MQCIGVLFAQVDLVFRAVEAEADGACCFAAVEIVDEERLNFLGHEVSPDRL
jgi:hypothetical protein